MDKTKDMVQHTSPAIKTVAIMSEQMTINDLQGYLEHEKNEVKKRLKMKITYDGRLEDFVYLKKLGVGGFGSVVLAKNKKTHKFFAIKVLIKKIIVQANDVHHALNEKRVLQSIRFPFVVHMEYFFQNNNYLFYVMPTVLGGQLLTYLHKNGKLPEIICIFYGAQIVLALEYLHFVDLVYRDLKPENILIDLNGYLRLTDFGFCKLIKDRTFTLCGTPAYLAPEIILNKGYGKPVDWWSYGILLYEMCAGFTPFHAEDHLKLYEKIVVGKYKVASHFTTDLVDILHNLLQVNVSKRYGNLAGGVSDIKKHSWFQVIDWNKVLNQQIKAPYLPKVNQISDIDNFEQPIEKIQFTASKHDLYAKEFANF